jgi:hypothetical protein
VTVKVPVGVVETEVEDGATLMVMTSATPDAGEAVVAERVVVVETSEEADEVVGQADKRLYRSTDPRPEASS